jgi:N6-L-threonylcarbamoyladenine synthase
MCWSRNHGRTQADRHEARGGGGRRGANKQLREQLNEACAKHKIRVHYPELHLCTDNGAMIAMAAAMRIQAGREQALHEYAFDVKPRWPLDSLR